MKKNSRFAQQKKKNILTLVLSEKKLNGRSLIYLRYCFYLQCRTDNTTHV